MDDDLFERGLAAPPVLVILRGADPAETIRLCDRAAALGVGLIEVPLQAAASRESLAAAVRWADGRSGITVGAGTILTPEAMREAYDLGARFSVAPGFDADVLAESLRLGCPHLPGVATGSEIQQALRHGCRWLKAFPATALGVEWFSAMRGPFPQIRLVATGGVDAGNAGEFLDAGAAAVSFGSAFARLDEAEFARLVAEEGH